MRALYGFGHWRTGNRVDRESFGLAGLVALLVLVASALTVAVGWLLVANFLFTLSCE